MLATRVGVLERLEKQFGTLTPAQWLLVQLHPELFAGADDVFSEVAFKVFARCSIDSVESVDPRKGYLTVVDEAQGLTNVLKGKLRAHRPSDPEKSRRSFLSAVITSSHLQGCS